MSKGNSGHFKGTLGTTYKGDYLPEDTYSDRGIEIPKKLQKALQKLKNNGDYMMLSSDNISMKDVSIMSKEEGVEFAKILAGDKMYIVRGSRTGTDIPKHLLNKMLSEGGKLEYHSHPHDDDCIPSNSDKNMMKLLRKNTGQKTSMIVTPNGRTCIFDENGVITTGIVSNRLSKNHKEALLKLFGGK